MSLYFWASLVGALIALVAFSGAALAEQYSEDRAVWGAYAVICLVAALVFGGLGWYTR